MNYWFIILCLCWGFASKAISVVYNLRIAETTKRQAAEIQKAQPWVAAETVFEINRTTYDNIHQNFAGSLSSLLYIREHSYAKIDWAFGNVDSKFQELHLSRIQTDDVVVTAGYSFKINNQATTTLSGLVGFPTHKNLGLQGAQIGTGHYGFGLQWDGAFILERYQQHSIRAAARYVHFFERTITTDLLGFNGTFKIAPGDLIDFLIAHHVNHGRHRLEFGYNSSFLANAKIVPNVEAVQIRSTYIRSNFYVTYAYLFKISHHISGIAIAFSGGFDHVPKKVGTKHIFTVWALWGINF
jgi:hypothetical protein